MTKIQMVAEIKKNMIISDGSIRVVMRWTKNEVERFYNDCKDMRARAGGEWVEA